MQNYYLTNKTFDSEKNIHLQLTFIGSLFQVLAFTFVIVGNMLYSVLGYRILLSAGLLLTSTGLIAAGWATSTWELYLSLSVCSGLGMSFLAALCLRILPQWFVKYRSTAFGIQASGTSFTILVVPFLIVHINKTLGPAWTYRILGISFLCLNIIAFLFIRERVATSRSLQQGKIDFSVLLNVNLVIWLFVGPLQLYASYTTFVFLPSYATYIGLSDVQGSAIISILAAAGICGRVGAGYIGDRIGNINTFIVSMFLCVISVLVIWMVAKSLGALVVFAVFNGFVYGTYYTLSAPVALSIVPAKQYPSALGLGMLAFAFAICGPVLASYLESKSKNHPFFSCKIISGVGYAACLLLTVILKFRIDKRPFAKV
ncbi:major facilitator superfamily domain-containing protein [Fennellomyces sp. T-0311]|nr:major facilitator superfamily domain-containing protein [Fennellomyces sp. T-0311]